jgi:hypothetical protein
VRYSKFSKSSVQNLAELNLDYFESRLENTISSTWGLFNGVMVKLKWRILLSAQVSKSVTVSDEFVKTALATNITIHKRYCVFQLFDRLKHFYDQTTQSVITLITRNKNKIGKEIVQSRN